MVEVIRINSRAGNRLIAVAGIVYALAALPLLGFHVATSWGAESLTDRALQLALALAICAGVAFVYVARTNLRRLQS